jgi:hypothetical protein
MAKQETSGSDYLLEAIHENWCDIMKAYRLFEKKKPVMVFDLQEQRIYAYPYAEFRNDLNERSQASLKEQYEQAISEGMFVLFVRDNEKKKFVSYSMPLQ